MDVLSYGFALVVFSGGFMGYMKAGMISVKSTPACINMALIQYWTLNSSVIISHSHISPSHFSENSLSKVKKNLVCTMFVVVCCGFYQEA